MELRNTKQKKEFITKSKEDYMHYLRTKLTHTKREVNHHFFELGYQSNDLNSLISIHQSHLDWGEKRIAWESLIPFWCVYRLLVESGNKINNLCTLLDAIAKELDEFE